MDPPYTQGRGTRQLRPILSEWARLHQRYVTELEGGDAAFYYTERANIGVLAAAVWMTGGVAVEEWSTQKAGDRAPVTGRNDLYFSTSTTEYQLEAKQLWIRIGPRTTRDSVRTQLANGLERAVRDAGRVDAAECDHRLAAVFAVPILTDRADADGSVELLHEALRECELGFAMWAPVSGLEPVETANGKRRRFPGVLFCGCTV